MKFGELVARLLSLLGEDFLDRAYRAARGRQHRYGDGWYLDKGRRWRRCRLMETDWGDPIMEECGCADEFVRDFRKKDLQDGCPRCVSDVAENALEPDVMIQEEQDE